MMTILGIGIGLLLGTGLVFAAGEGHLRDAMGGIVLAVLVAIAMALSLTLIGCTGTGEYYDIPVDFGAYPSTVAPLSISNCSGQ